MVRKELGTILAPILRQRLDPPRDANVPVDPVGPRQLAVDRVADERVDEGVLGRPRDSGAPVAAQELLAPERAEQLVDRRPVVLGDGAKPVGPDDAAHHRRVSEELLLGRWQQIDPCRDDPEDAVGQSLDVAAGRLHAHELLGVERVPRRPLDDRLAELPSAGSRPEQRLDEARRLVPGERPERDRDRIPLAAAPVRPALEQLGSRAGDDEERYALDEVDEAVDEVEQPVVGPLEVVDHEDERSPLGERLEEDPPAGEELRPAVAEPTSSGVEPDERLEARRDPARSASGTRSSTLSASFVAVSAASSFSWIPACALTISPSAQNETPSPYGRQRP